jgi:hypothetical protein
MIESFPMRSRRLLAGFLLSLFAVAHAQAAITGVVHRQGTTIPLPGISIAIWSGCHPGGTHCALKQFTSTANDGTFLVDNPAAGGSDFLFATDDQGDYLQVAFLPVTDGSNVTVEMILGGTISGIVTRASDGTPLANVTLGLLPSDQLGAAALQATTDAAGSYRFTKVPVGSYAVRTEQPAPYQEQFYAGRALTPPSQGQQLFDAISVVGGQDSQADFSLTVGGTIHGVLYDRYLAAPIANASNVIFDGYDPAATSISGSWFEFASTSTDAQGNFTIEGLPDAAFVLGARILWSHPLSIYGCTDPCTNPSQGTTLQVSAGSTRNGLQFPLFPGSVVTGTVTQRSDGTPIPGATVTAYENFMGGLPIGSTVTNAQGHFTLIGELLANNTYYEVTNATLGGIAYISQDYHDHNCIAGQCAPFSGNAFAAPLYTVSSGVDFALDPGAAISGQLVQKDTSLGTPGYVRVVTAAGNLAGAVNTAADGTFKTEALQAGTYYLIAYSQNAAYDCVVYGSTLCTSDGALVVASGTPLTIAGTQNINGVVIAVPHDVLFANGFE